MYQNFLILFPCNRNRLSLFRKFYNPTLQEISDIYQVLTIFSLFNILYWEGYFRNAIPNRSVKKALLQKKGYLSKWNLFEIRE